jgi:hypothetical protein
MANDRMKPVSIDDYIAGFPPEAHTSLPLGIWEDAVKFFL